MSYDAIVFFIPQMKLVSGGVMSIFSLCQETRELFDSKKTSVYISVLPGYPTYGTNNFFENSETIYDMDSLIGTLHKKKNILFHVPEYAVNDAVIRIRPYFDKLKKARLSVNILNQNVKLMPSRIDAAEIFEISPHVTQTVAHRRYCTQEMADSYAIPTHLFSVFIDPSQYKSTQYAKKKNIIAYSPDGHPDKESILEILRQNLPNYELIEINNLSYEQYKKLIRDVKFVITFGEGLDGYLIEPTFSGTVAFSVFNSDFFPDDSFTKLATIFDTYEEMAAKLVSAITSLDTPESYPVAIAPLYEKLAEIYSYASYKKNVEAFYHGDLSFYPNTDALYSLLSDKLAHTLPALHEALSSLESTRGELATTSNALAEKTAILDHIYRSKKWRYANKIQHAFYFFMPWKHID
jgi:hypothetical protein